MSRGCQARRRVLTIEDDDAVFRNWERLLVERAELVRAKSFEAAWKRTDPEEWTSDPCDCVFLDLRLPDGDGMDLLDRLERLLPRPPVAVLSGFVGPREALALHGRCAVVPKPASRDILLKVLTLLEGACGGDAVLASFTKAYGLSPQEARLLDGAAKDVTNDELADLLGCAPSTIRSYWSRIFQKTNCHSAREVLALLFRESQSFALQTRRPPIPKSVP